jgi:hypothetical protein
MQAGGTRLFLCRAAFLKQHFLEVSHVKPANDF